ncbi:MAG: diacylglycerol kinase family lipid kinase, partial [Planctomycetota bacterium]
ISDSLIRSDVVIAPVRQGTGGDFARFMGLSGRLPDAVEHLKGESTRPCDIGLVEFTDHNGGRRRRAFLNIASFGMSGLVDEKVNGSTKVLGGTTSFLVGLGQALMAYRPQRVRVSVDGSPFYEDRMVTAAVANGQYFGGGMHFAPRATFDDGLFDIVVQVKSGLKEVLSIRDLYSGRIVDWPTVRTARGRRIDAVPLDAEDRVLLDVDGEQPGCLPATFRILPSAVRLKVSAAHTPS